LSTPGTETPDAVPETTREELLKVLDRECAVAQATNGRLAVLVIELHRVDRLHALLRGPAPQVTMGLVVDRLRKALRPEDRVAALGEEQVCVVLPRLAHPSQSVLAAVRILRALDRPIAHEGGSAVLRPCIGIASLPEHSFDPAELLMAADVSCHIAATREEGYHVFSADDTVETDVYKGLDLDLERAVRANELELHFQPQVALAGARPVGVEALLRWKHLTAGNVPPPNVIGIAERTGLIGALTFWIMNAAMRQCADWQREGLELRMAINLSTSILSDRELPAIVDQCLKTWGVLAETVTLEIPESSMIADAEKSAALLTRLKAVGVALAIDDFGSGFTSLGHLRRFPLDELKIDRPFVAGLLSDKGDAALVRSAIDVGRNFGLRVLAEGVEALAVGKALEKLGCELAQGHAYGAAMPAAQLVEWWKARAINATP
jgi:predicted signal transduction protein with EAL and GGDEF domain